VLLDIYFIAFGFLLRVLAGGEAFRIPVTSWLFLTVFSVSLLLATGKRLGEMVSMGESAHMHRKSLSKYSVAFLEGTLWFSASAACVMYALYTLEHKNGLYYTVPLVVFGLLRYIFIVKEGKGDPTDALLKDRQIMVVGILWTVMLGLMIY
jgi:4-hydroxybenzoate polyprenyltransferase